MWLNAHSRIACRDGSIVVHGKYSRVYAGNTAAAVAADVTAIAVYVRR